MSLELDSVVNKMVYRVSYVGRQTTSLRCPGGGTDGRYIATDEE